MDFRVLGALEVVQDGQVVPLASFRQRSLLAHLLIHAGEVVPSDRLIDDLWGATSGSDRQGVLWVHVSNLRSALEPDRAPRSPGTVLLTRSPGYVLQASPQEIDAGRFEALLGEARLLLGHDPGAASVTAGEALALWRGRAYEDVAYEPWAQAEIARLEERRLEAVELRVDADLRRGLAGELVGELEALARQHPLRERFSAALMLALYRSGRRAEALRAYTRLRTRLGEELGLEPSASLSTLEARILAQDPTLDAGHGGGSVPGRLSVRGYELREEVGRGRFGPAHRAYQPLVGREVTVEVIEPGVANDPSFVQRFVTEAAAIARLEHPHIVPLYDYWREPDGAFLVYRAVRGVSLADAVRAGPLAADAVADLASDLASAIGHAHANGVVHGGVTPDRVVLDGLGGAGLADFGLASIPPAVPPAAHDDAFLAPEVRLGHPATTASDVYGLGAVVTFALTGRPPGEARPPGATAAVLDAATALDPGERPADPVAVAATIRAALGAAAPATPTTRAPATNPYKGLRSFAEADQDDFFGRERLVERLVVRLGDAGTLGRFVAVVGPSGSGKSSLVHAGVVPAVRAGAVPGSARWTIVPFTPGASPFEALEAALRRVAVHPPAGLLDDLVAGAHGIRRAVGRVVPDDGALVLLVIDQFEELFTQAAPATADAFLDALAEAVTDAHSGVRAIVTLRADFYDRPLGRRAAGELLRAGTEVVTPMSPSELERAIGGPAERAGLHLAPGLVAELVADVADRNALPLLQYVLAELVDGRQGPVIDLDAYRSLGGLTAALGRRAEALFHELDPPSRDIARQVFLRLVALGGAAEVARRRVPRHELHALGEPAVGAVLDAFGRHRLLGFDRDPVTRAPTVEIAHEALLAAWPRLAGWVESGRDDVRRHRRLAAAVAEWRAASCADGYLLRGPLLDELAAWAARTDLVLHPGERDLLRASVAQRDRDRAEDATRRLREQRVHRQAHRRATLLVVAAAVLAVVVVLAVVAVREGRHADRLAGERSAASEARRLAAASVGLARDDPDLALLLALQALDVSVAAGVPAVPEAEDALHWALQEDAATFPVGDGETAVRLGPDGRAGVFALALPDLVALARDRLDRSLTSEECARHRVEHCPADGGGLATPSTAGDAPLPEAAERADGARGGPAGPAADLRGTTVTVWGLEPASGGLDRELARLDERGIRVDYRVVDPDEYGAGVADDPSEGLPDVLLLSTQDQVRALAEQGRLVDLGAFLDRDELQRGFGPYLVDSLGTGSGLFGIPVRIDLKGLVWYPPKAFAAAGYAVPESWAELLALSERMVADGRTPWCLGLASGEASGWPATDWIEALLLRLGGVAAYDQWVEHEIPFDAPLVRDAAGMFGEVVFGRGFVADPGTADRAGFDAQAAAMATDPPQCWMHHMASFQAGALPAGVRPGVDADVFVLPPLTAGDPVPHFGGAVFAVARRDRPEVRELLRTIARADWGERWARHPGSGFLPAHAGFDPAGCRSDGDDAAAGELRVRLCTLARDAIAADAWRMDGSDDMPPAVGAGAFWRAMLAFTTSGPASLDGLLASIEASWPDPPDPTGEA